MIKFFEDLTKVKSRNYRSLNEGAVQELMTSIRELGVQEPVRLFEVEDTKEQYILSGHHRVEAVRRLQATSPGISYRVPAIVIKGSKQDLESSGTTVAAVISNVMRPDMDVVDRAVAYRQLREAGMTAESIARAVGKSKRAVEMGLAVADLDESTKLLIKSRPETKEAAVYKAAAQFKRDPKADIRPLLEARAPKTGRETKTTAKVDVEAFAERLRSKLKLQEPMVSKILAAL